MSPTKDPFTKIHSLLRRSKLSTALDLLRNAQTNLINEAFRFDKNHAWYCVGDILYRQNHFDEAKNAFKRSVRIRPDDSEALTAIGNCYDELKKPKYAERYFRRALILSAKNVQKSERSAITLNLANALYDQGRMKEAVKLYKKLSNAPDPIKQRAEKNLALAKSKK